MQLQVAKYAAEEVPSSLLVDFAIPDARFESQSLVGPLPNEATVSCTVECCPPKGVVYRESKFASTSSDRRNVMVWSI